MSVVKKDSVKCQGILESLNVKQKQRNKEKNAEMETRREINETKPEK